MDLFSRFAARFALVMAAGVFVLLAWPLVDMLRKDDLWPIAIGILISAAVPMGAFGAFMLWRAVKTQLHRRLLRRLIGHDGPPQALCDMAGNIIALSDGMMTKILRDAAAKNLLQQLEFKSPDAASVLAQIQAKAVDYGRSCLHTTIHTHSFMVCATCIDRTYVFWQFIPQAGPYGLPQGILDDMPPVVDITRHGQILTRNAAAEALLGQKSATSAQLFSNVVPSSGMVLSITLPQSGQPITVMFQEILRVNDTLTVMMCPLPDSSQRISGFLDFPVPLLKLDPSSRILQANREARFLLGPLDPAGKRLGDVLHGLGRSVGRWVQDAADGKSHVRSEFLRVTIGTQERVLQVTLRRAIDNAAPVVYAILQDATEMKALEEKFTQSHKMQAIGQLAGGVAHDFNNLLTAITGHCDLLLYNRDQYDPDFADIKQIQQNAHRAAALVSQLLAFSRKQTLQPEALEVRSLISDMGHLLTRLTTEKISIDQTFDDDLWHMRADRRQIEQVLMNLVVNARDAMPGGGQIHIHVKNQVIADGVTNAGASVAPGNYVQIAISDEGGGIEKHILDRIFDPFFTTKKVNEGTGLGLSMVYGIIKQTGGYVFVTSTVGQGSTFTLLIPAVAAADFVQLDDSQKPEAKPQPVLGHVLLVEDEAPVRIFAARALALRGLKVTEAASGDEALDLLNASGSTYSLFITDVMMPGLTGPEWVQKARADGHDTPVIFTSGYAENALGEDADAFTNAHFLPKPFSLVALGQAVDQALGGG